MLNCINTEIDKMFECFLNLCVSCLPVILLFIHIVSQNPLQAVYLSEAKQIFFVKTSLIVIVN